MRGARDIAPLGVWSLPGRFGTSTKPTLKRPTWWIPLQEREQIIFFYYYYSEKEKKKMKVKRGTMGVDDGGHTGGEEREIHR